MIAAITPSTLASTISPFPMALEDQPKRVILRLRVSDFEGKGRSWEQYIDAVQAYLTWAGHPPNEHDEGLFEPPKHFAHVEPFQDPEVRQTTFDVVLDMEQDMLNEPNFDFVPHEIYRVCRDKQGNLEVRAYEDPREAENVLHKTRHFTDVVYPWARQKPRN